jgi:hypothetical protein
MTGAGLSIIWAGLAASFIAAVASIAAAVISRQIKISEFRQAWINELRKDIADSCVPRSGGHRGELG